MPKPAPAEPVKIPTQLSTTIAHQLTGGGFIVDATRADEKAVNSIKIRRHGSNHLACRSCEKPNVLPPMELSKAELGTLIQLLQQVRDEMLPGLEKYGVEE